VKKFSEETYATARKRKGRQIAITADWTGAGSESESEE